MPDAACCKLHRRPAPVRLMDMTVGRQDYYVLASIRNRPSPDSGQGHSRLRDSGSANSERQQGASREHREQQCWLLQHQGALAKSLL